jgi:hypothetical protein
MTDLFTQMEGPPQNLAESQAAIAEILPVDCAMHPALGDPAARFYPARVWAGELGANQTRRALFATSNQ